MVISDLYDIHKLANNLEVALQIDGVDYAEKNIDTVIKNVRNRIISHYQIDLTKTNMADPALYMGKSRNAAILFLENITNLHAQLCGYLQICRYTASFLIKPINVNYLGIDDNDLMNFFQATMRKKTIPAISNAMEVVKQKVSTINACLEKKLLMIMIVSYELGFHELMATIAEIFYLGGKV